MNVRSHSPTLRNLLRQLLPCIYIHFSYTHPRLFFLFSELTLQSSEYHHSHYSTTTTTMHTTAWIFATLLAFTATASPTNNTLVARAPPPVKYAVDTFQIRVVNNCPFRKTVALYQIITPNGAMQMVQRSTPVAIAPHHTQIMTAPFRDIGMRLSGHGEWGVDAQWQAQALFEFGYSAYAGMEGTAYDLSIMEGSDRNVGLAVEPKNKKCWSKKCGPGKCPVGEGWTKPEQAGAGSPADTVCYQGKTDFKVTFCP